LPFKCNLQRYIAGYFSGRLFKMFQLVDWKINTLQTAGAVSLSHPADPALEEVFFRFYENIRTTRKDRRGVQRSH
jgi:hypothetical protein